MKHGIDAFVLTFPHNTTTRAIAFCSRECGNAALDEPPRAWRSLRVRVPAVLTRVVSCHGCGQTIAEAAEALARCGR